MSRPAPTWLWCVVILATHCAAWSALRRADHAVRDARRVATEAIAFAEQHDTTADAALDLAARCLGVRIVVMPAAVVRVMPPALPDDDALHVLPP